MTDEETVYLREPSSELLFRFIYIDKGNIPVQIMGLIVSRCTCLIAAIFPSAQRIYSIQRDEVRHTETESKPPRRKKKNS